MIPGGKFKHRFPNYPLMIRTAPGSLLHRIIIKILILVLVWYMCTQLYSCIVAAITNLESAKGARGGAQVGSPGCRNLKPGALGIWILESGICCPAQVKTGVKTLWPLRATRLRR